MIYLESFDSESGLSCADDTEKKLEKQLSRERYLINLRGSQLINAIDNQIKKKREEDELAYDQLMKKKAIMDCMKPKRGKKLEIPCEIKIRALKFLTEAFEAQRSYEDVDFEDEVYREQCHHDFKGDREEEYEQKLLKSVNEFHKEIPGKSREKFLADKALSKRNLILNIIH